MSELLYYIQNQGYVGNCLRWWVEGGHGYTCDLNKAWKVTLEEAERICQNRPQEDRYWPVSLVDAQAERHIVSTVSFVYYEDCTSGMKAEPTLRPILNFKGPYRFLSNFYIEPDGTTVEAEFQAQKHWKPSRRPYFQKKFYDLGPSVAKLEGRQLPLRPDWEEAKRGIMFRLVLQKFRDHSELRHRLLATGKAALVEENSWRDRYWGVYHGVGENHLGKILMQVRAILRAEERYSSNREEKG